jgi:hypothetical protein
VVVDEDSTRVSTDIRFYYSDADAAEVSVKSSFTFDGQASIALANEFL